MKLFFIHLLSVLISLVEVAALLMIHMLDFVLLRSSYMCDCECSKACNKTDEYLDTKNFSCKKCLVGKLVLEREDEILNTIETLFNDKM